MIRKLLKRSVWKRIYLERLGEPFIYNLVSVFVLLFGNVVQKIRYDCVPRHPYAFGMNEAFDLASRHDFGIERLVFLEFGVASGGGLLNMCRVADKLSAHYGIDYRVIGLDSGVGMPDPIDYRDHPEFYLPGDFKPHDKDAIIQALPSKASIIYGPISETVKSLKLDTGEAIGFVSVDVDYYSSTVDCLQMFDADTPILPRLPMYFDDVYYPQHHKFAGELLAIEEFNEVHERRKITQMNGLANFRIFKNARYLSQMYWCHDFDSQYYTAEFHSDRRRIQLDNPYLGFDVVD